MNRNLIVLDPAHGGPDAGAALGEHLLEKDVSLALAARLRAALTAQGFTVISTRDADLSDPLTGDQRAEQANRTHALACLVLHATMSGSGVHLYTSALQPSEPQDNSEDETAAQFVPSPWESAQAGFVSQTLRLAGDLKTALVRGNLAVVAGKSSVRPLDNLMCPAVAVELAPLKVSSGDPVSADDANYQQRVVSALSTALQAWRAHANVSPANGTRPSQTAAPGAQAHPAAKAVPGTQPAGHPPSAHPASPAPAAGKPVNKSTQPASPKPAPKPPSQEPQ
jgi:N-acetylmuramoyl-L-alanine amidase